jgi:NAD(P)-dependent dehydrogenase (short-subunit alcohol dehydrogenase family)
VLLLKDRVAVITGAASGIGRATARLFAQEGAKVVVVDTNEMGARQTVESIEASSGQALCIRADVSSKRQVEGMVERALAGFGRLDIVHSNAGAYETGTAQEITEAGWNRTVDVCLKATWLLARAIVPVLLDRDGGVFIITGSVHAIRGYPGHVAYQAAKGGLLALTRALAADYAPRVRVNTILPGAIVTGLWDGIAESERQKIARMCPMQRNGRPEDVAQAALFLASDMSAYMTGASLVVDGGLSSIVTPQWEL